MSIVWQRWQSAAIYALQASLRCHDRSLDENGGCLRPTQTGGPITPCRKTVSLCKKSAQIVTKFSKTIILLCRRILVQLQCSLTSNELHMQGREENESTLVFVKPKFKWNKCAVHVSHVKMQRLPFWQVVPERWQWTGLIGLSVAPYPLNRISRVTLLWHSCS